MSKLKMKVLGLMSGTSLDGVDLALSEFDIIRKKVKYRFIRGKTFPYPANLRKKLAGARKLNGEELILLDRESGRFFGELISAFLKGENADLIASHGHTVFHQPEKGITFQIGSGAEIAAKTGIKTICDFRTTDMALGGQGAPLVPFGDELLFGEYDYCLNLGGYSNISFRSKKKRMALDVSPCNVLLNYLADKKGKNFDDKGKWASKGKLNKNLFSALNSVRFYQSNQKHSLGNEWYEREILPIIEKSKASTEDKLHTCCEHIAFQLAQWINEDKSVLTTGGGAYNDYLISRISALTGSKIIIPQVELIEFKEALLFGLLGYMREKEWINTFCSSTGAKRDSSGGAVYNP